MSSKHNHEIVRKRQSTNNLISLDTGPFLTSDHQPEYQAEDDTLQRNLLSDISLSCFENSKYLVMQHFEEVYSFINEEESLGQVNTQLLNSFPEYQQQNTVITPLKTKCNLQSQIEVTDFFYQAEDVVEYFSQQISVKSNPQNSEDFEKNTLVSSAINQQILSEHIGFASRAQTNLPVEAAKTFSEDNYFHFFEPNNMNFQFSEIIKNPDTASTQCNENNISLSLFPNEESYADNEKPVFLLQSPLDSKNSDYFSKEKEIDQSRMQFEQEIVTIPSDNSQLQSTKDIEEKRSTSGSFSASTLACFDDISENIERQVKQNIYKSIFNAFKCFVKSNKMEIKSLFPQNKDMNNQLKQLARHLKKHSFNHKVLQYLVHHGIYSTIFQHFIDCKCSYWIQKSKILNKRAAQEVLSILQACFKDKSLIDNLVCYKTVGKKKKTIEGKQKRNAVNQNEG